MIWNNPPKFIAVPTPPGKKVTPEALAKSGTEDGSQMALFAWAASAVPIYPQLKWLFAIPNGGSRHIAEATKMVATGLRRGVPDVFLPAQAPKHPPESEVWYNGCWIELKIEKKRNTKNDGCSQEQVDWIEYLTAAGYYCKVCYSWTEARDTLINYLEGKL